MYVSNVENSVTANPDALWKFINNKKWQKRIPATMNDYSGELNNPESMHKHVRVSLRVFLIN